MKRFFALCLSVIILGAGCTAYEAPHGNGLGTSVPSARGLNLSGRGLTAIPSDVFSRTDLERLDLSNNRLTGAPQAEIRNLQQLTFLDLSGNQLTGLPAELGQLKNLETLNVANNQLTGLPVELGNLTQLRLLDISGNPYSA